MKRFFTLTAILVLALFAATASAQLTATSAPVQMKAIVPEYIGLHVANTAAVVFDYSLMSDVSKDQFVQGYSGIMMIAPTAPSWNLVYNLSNRTVTVCAYATDLTPTTGSDIIPATYINGIPLQSTTLGGGGYVFFGQNNAGCGAGPGASTMIDKITGAKSSYKNEPTHMRPEGFSMLQINAHEGTDTVPLPGTYLGTLYIVAQAI